MLDMSRMSAPVFAVFGRVPGGWFAPAARMVVCAALPWYVCVWIGTTTAPVAAALPAVLVLRQDVFAAPRLAFERLVGVIAGVLLTVAVLHWLPTGPLTFPVVLVCGCAGMYLLGAGGSANQQVLITALVIYGTADPGYPLARLWESAVGVAVVTLLGPLLWPPDPYREAARGLEAYRVALLARLEGISGRLAAGTGAPAATAATATATATATAGAYALWHRPYEVSAALDRMTARRLSPLARRTPTRAPDEGPHPVRPRLRLAGRTAPALHFFGRELESRAPSGDDGAVRALAPLVDATARALDAALRGADCGPGLLRARELEAAHRAAHPARRDAALRAGLHLTHEALADHLAAPPA
ncbi:FUSC family protein [Streptomyces sp. NPDC087917]|uniref:FUSC family protein n=1 Tax=Streptomyces sp. NPDC087917 TaxID=3155060 RepID=UPI00343F7D40